jgi:hypothetical protein
VFAFFVSSRKTQEVLIEYKTNQYLLRCDYDVDTNMLKKEFEKTMKAIDNKQVFITEDELKDQFYEQIDYFEQRFYKNRY